LDLLDAGAPIEDAINEWVLKAQPSMKDNDAGDGCWGDYHHGHGGMSTSHGELDAMM